MEADEEDFSSGVSGEEAGSSVDEEDDSLSSSLGQPEAPVSTAAPPLFLSFDRKQSVARQKEVLEQAVSALGLSCRSVARALLRLYRWRVGEAATAWASDADRVAKLLGLSNVHVVGGVLGKAGEGSCSVCFEEGELWGLGSCEHVFCRPCWKDFVASEIEAQRGHLVSCMGDKCNKSVMEDVSVAELLPKQLKSIYVNQLVDSFISANANCVFCPSNLGCEGIVERLDDAVTEVKCCLCDTEFCFLCKERPHEPAACDGFASFMARKDEATNASEKLIEATSKACPGCGARIYKHSGCNHVTCASCEYHFCWQCNGKFGSGPKGGSDGYGSHKCASMDVKNVKSLDKFKALGEDESRFYWFVERFDVSHRAIVLGKEIESSEMLKLVLLEMSGSSLFVTDGIRTMIRARKVLADSYIAAFYRLSDEKRLFISKDLFEFRLQALSQVIDILSHLLEETIRTKTPAYKAAKQLAKDRVRILSVTRATDDCIRSLIEVASEGQDKKEIAAILKAKSIKSARR